MKTTENHPDPDNENNVNEEEAPLDETGADDPNSNNTEENSEGRKEGKSYYEKLRELDEDSTQKK